MKKILVLHSSARKHGNTDLLVDEFIRGALEAKNTVDKEYIGFMKINGCLNCNACKRNDGKCVQHDDMVPIYDKLQEADIIVFASPVYFYNVNTQMKAVMDRTYAFEKSWKNKQTWLIATGAAPEQKFMETMITNFKQFSGCFEGFSVGGIIIGYGTPVKGDIKNNPAMQQAYEAGKNIK
jgi:multimeric flavodoxin WrbA